MPLKKEIISGFHVGLRELSNYRVIDGSDIRKCFASIKKIKASI